LRAYLELQTRAAAGELQVGQTAEGAQGPLDREREQAQEPQPEQVQLEFPQSAKVQ